MTTITIPERIFEKLRRKAEAKGVSAEEYILSLIVELADSSSLVDSYLEASKDLIRRAKDELARGDLRQASEKIWGSAAMAVKAAAYSREAKRLSSHGEIWEYVSKLVEETGDEELGRLWRSAISMHVNFYEGWATKEQVESALRDAEALVGKLKRII